MEGEVTRLGGDRNWEGVRGRGGSSSATASRDLRELVNRGMFERIGCGTTTRYELPEPLRSLRQVIMRLDMQER